MLSFQARKKEDNYLVPVYNYMNGGATKTASTPTQSSSKYMSTPTSNYLPKSQNVQKPIYQPYANLQSSMRTASKPGYTTPTVNKPVVKPPVTTPTPTVTQPTSPLSKLQQIGANRQQFAQQQADQEAERQKGIFDIRSKALEAQKPELEGRLNKYRDLSRQAIAGQEAITAGEKERIELESGKEMRLNAQTAREGRARLQNTMAGLNTLDSGVTPRLLAMAEGNLANNQATAQQAQTQKIREADQNLTLYKQQAQLAEDDEIAKFNDAMRTIAANYDINSLEYQNAVKAAYDKAQESIYNIEEGVANAELDVQKIYDTAYATEDAKQQVAGTGNGKSEIANVINTLMNRDTGAITGLRNPFAFMTGDAQLTKNYYNQLKGLLSLENRAKLKGSGAISDFESKTLDRAASALGTNLSNEGFKQVLGELASVFGGGQSQGGMITMQSPDGQTYQVDQAEAQEAMANGWRQV